MIVAGLFDGVIDDIQSRIIGAFSSALNSVTTPLFGWISDPLIHWYVYLAAFFVVCAVIGWFFDFKWVKAGLGALIALAVAFVAGGWKMRQIDNERAERSKPKPKPKPAAKKPDGWSW